MIFLRFNADGREWGYHVTAGYIPAIGDTVLLWYAKPDTEANDCVRGVVKARTFYFGPDFLKWQEIDYDVVLKERIPDDYIADSAEWPSLEYTVRSKQFEAIFNAPAAEESP